MFKNKQKRTVSQRHKSSSRLYSRLSPDNCFIVPLLQKRRADIKNWQVFRE